MMAMLKNLLSLLLIIVSSLSIQAQDTITIQTITRDNAERAGTYTFPDGNQSFEKILMIYNIRCKDNIVNTTGGNDVGCGEWDYSCNTFISDPTQTDSTRSEHPTHTISGFNGQTFEYTTQPTYTYYQYEQQEVTNGTVINEATSSVGMGTESLSLPEEEESGRIQFLYSADQIISGGLTAGELTGLRLEFIEELANVPNLRIALKATNKVELDASDPDLDGFTEVYFLSTEVATSGMNNFNFYENFAWDGTSNLIIQLTFAGETQNFDLNATATQTVHALLSGEEDRFLEFSGYGNAEIGSEAFDEIENELTISFWSKGDETVLPVNSSAFEGFNEAGQRSANAHLPWSNGQVYWDCGFAEGNYDRINKVAPASAYAGNWSHWAFTKNATTGTMKIFLNGEEWHSGSGKTKPIYIDAMKIGSAFVESNRHFGQLDNFRIWNKALDEATIRNWMYREVNEQHPDYENLQANYRMNEDGGNVLVDASGNGYDATLTNNPTRRSLRGRDIFKGFTASDIVANAVFVSGTYDETSIETVTYLDSIENNPVLVTEYGTEANELVTVNETYYFAAGEMNILNEADEVIGTVSVTPEGSIEIGSLEYYLKQSMEIELLSLVTPYGIGLDLGDDGKSFVFDVTDYAPVLRGERDLYLSFGKTQEEHDIKFQFITGTPPREVVGFQNVWPFRRSGYADIQNDVHFEPRELKAVDNAAFYKLRSAITGHDQNGEFVPRNHYVNVNGGPQEFVYQVWKECADNPIYPQGGTWTFDRAGWCPGAATDVHEFDISEAMSSGTVMVDYGVNGAFLSAANYLVSNQLVTYGPYNFNNDAAVVEVIRPSKRVEFERLNPICNEPVVVIRNTGAETLTSLKIDYQVIGSYSSETFLWEGNLGSMESEEVALPINSTNFFATNEEQRVFEVSISEPNGVVDEYAPNNSMRSEFELPLFLPEGFDFQIQLKTNNRPAETNYTITDLAGNVVMSRENLQANTTYDDDINLPAGCYSIELNDSNDDGLSYWFDPAAGSGDFGIRRITSAGLNVPFQQFESEFGKFIRFDFTVGEITDVESEQANVRFLSVSPNPTDGEVRIELQGFEGERNLEILALDGRLLQRKVVRFYGEELQTHFLSLADRPAGIYLVRITGADGVITKQVVKQ
ncbi:hypothetical protein CEQ90_07510 [Lewinellaceae bacterium SD302]|nr:hypothetical protein CEQ90_07510 [Lewinellaceae bacterium SD302]